MFEKRAWLLPLLLLLLSPWHLLMSQELLFNFSHVRETYTWSDSLLWQPDYLGKDRLLFTNSSNSTLTRESVLLDRKDRWQEGYRSRFVWQAIPSDSVGRLGLAVEFVNDYNSFEERIYVANKVGIVNSYRPDSRLKLEHTLFWINDARNNFGKRHISGGVEDLLALSYRDRLARSTSLAVDYDQSLEIVKDVPRRAFRVASALYSYSRVDTLSANLQAAYENNRYFTSTQDFESTSRQIKTAASANVDMSWQPMSRTRVRINSNMDLRKFRYRHFNETETTISSGLLGSDNDATSFDYKLAGEREIFGRILLESHYMYRQSRENYGNLEAGQEVRTGEVRLAARAEISVNDSIWIESIFSATGYFSDKASVFFSDRDRLLRLYQTGVFHRFNSVLAMRVDGSYRDFHQTYVSGALSANNNHNEVWVVRPTVYWRPVPWLRIENSFLLHANYIWYDHEKNRSSERNTLFRRANWRSAYDIDVSRKLSVSTSYSYRYEDYGQLLWTDQWVQKRNWDRRSHLPTLSFIYRPFSGLRIEPLLSYEWKQSWEFALKESGAIERARKEYFKRTTVSFALFYAPSRLTDLKFEVTRRVQVSNLYAEDRTSQVVVNLSRKF